MSFTLLGVRDRTCSKLDFILSNYLRLHAILPLWFQSLLSGQTFVVICLFFILQILGSVSTVLECMLVSFLFL